MFYEKVGISLTLVDNVNGSPPSYYLLCIKPETTRYSYIISVRLYVQILYVHMYCIIHICGIE